jgi:hypothetical protein
MRLRLALLAVGCIGPLGLAACSAGSTGGAAAPSSSTAAMVPNPPLPPGFQCAAGLTSTRSNGKTAVYGGGSQNDPGMCVTTINGQPSNGYLGVLGPSVSPEARAAINKLVTGAPGTTVTFAGPAGMQWTAKVLDRNDYSFDGKIYPTVHYAASSGWGQEEVWMDSDNGMFLKYAGRGGAWAITSLKPTGG